MSSDDYSRTLFGWALTPVLPTVLLVPFSCMTTLALAQLGIWNNYAKQPFLKRLSRELRWAQSRTARWTESRGCLNDLGEADPVLPDWQNPVSRALGAQVFILLWGMGPSLVIDCTCMSHELLKHVDQHSRSYWQWVSISSVSRAPHWHCQWLGGNGMGRPHWLESLWHPPLNSAEHPRLGLFMNKNITLWKHIMDTVKYDHKKYKIQGTMA